MTELLTAPIYLITGAILYLFFIFGKRTGERFISRLIDFIDIWGWLLFALFWPIFLIFGILAFGFRRLFAKKREEEKKEPTIQEEKNFHDGND